MSLLTTLTAYGRTKYWQRVKTRPQVEQWQQQKLFTFLRYLGRYAPYYQAFFTTRPLSAWAELPIMDKTQMMAQFDQLNTAGLKREDVERVALQAEQSRDFSPTWQGYTVGLSSGTSGNRGLFVLSPAEQSQWAGTVLAKMLRRPLWERQKIAFFLRANNNLYGRVGQRQIQFQFFDLLDPLEQHIQRLNQLQPTILVAPPSMLRFLAEQLGQTLHLAPHQIIGVAEVLDSLDQQVIAQKFHRPVDQIYQATEGFIAHTCAHGTLHLNEDVLLVEREYLDEQQTKFVPILTDFRRLTQPFVRYRLNDVLTLATQPCPCGSPFTPLSQIDGRCDDIFYWRSENHNQLVPVFPDYLSRVVISSSPAVTAYQVRQVALDVIEIALQIASADRPTAEQAITQAMWQLSDRLNCVRPHIHFDHLPTTLPSHLKRKRVINAVKEVLSSKC